MRPLTLAVAVGALLVATQANAGSFPVNRLTGVESGLVDKVAVRVYVHEGRRYCFYFDGWHGPGWYRCGFAWRRGLGWGGVYGWNSWSYGPWERHHRHGEWRDHHRRGELQHHRRGDRIGAESGSTRSRSSVETRGRTRSTTGAQGNTRMRSTTGRGPGADVQTRGNIRMQGGASGGPSVRGSTSGRGGASVNAPAAGGGASIGGGTVGGGGERK